MKLEEAIQMLRSYAGMTHKVTDNQGRPKLDQALEIVLNHITKQDKMIGNIFSYLDDHRIDDNICDEILDYGAKDCIHNGNCTECIKQYFEKKVEEQKDANI